MRRRQRRLTATAFVRYLLYNGEVAERLNAPVLKTGKGLRPSWVRIPPSPPLDLKDFSGLQTNVSLCVSPYFLPKNLVADRTPNEAATMTPNVY